MAPRPGSLDIPEGLTGHHSVEGPEWMETQMEEDIHMDMIVGIYRHGQEAQEVECPTANSLERDVHALRSRNVGLQRHTQYVQEMSAAASKVEEAIKELRIKLDEAPIRLQVFQEHLVIQLCLLQEIGTTTLLRRLVAM